MNYHRGMKLAYKTALITGSTGKLGRHIAIELAKHGCMCICHYNRSADKAEQLIAEIEADGGKAIAVPADFGLGEMPDELFEPVPDILINSASVFLPDNSPDTETLEKTMFINAEINPGEILLHMYQLNEDGGTNTIAERTSEE